MKKNKILFHFRDIIKSSKEDICLSTGISIDQLEKAERDSEIIPANLIKFYSEKLNITLSIMNVIFSPAFKKQKIEIKLQEMSIGLILLFLDFSKRMESYSEKHK